jgi:hypothetical protein
MHAAPLANFNPLRLSSKDMYHLLSQSVMLHFVFMRFIQFSAYKVIISLNSINQLIFVMAKCGVLFEVWNKFLNNI